MQTMYRALLGAALLSLAPAWAQQDGAELNEAPAEVAPAIPEADAGATDDEQEFSLGELRERVLAGLAPRLERLLAEEAEADGALTTPLRLTVGVAPGNDVPPLTVPVATRRFHLAYDNWRQQHPGPPEADDEDLEGARPPLPPPPGNRIAYELTGQITETDAGKLLIRYELSIEVHEGAEHHEFATTGSFVLTGPEGSQTILQIDDRLVVLGVAPAD